MPNNTKSLILVENYGGDMNKILKIFGLLLIGIIGIVLVAVIYINTSFPNVEIDESFRAELTDVNLERGKYLVESVTACFHCHSNVDFSKFSGEIVAGTEGGGGRMYTEADGFPGKFYASNITPHALKEWSDAEIYRSITGGVSKDGDPLFPLMPYASYRYLTMEDSKSIVAYLRTLNPIEKEYEESEFGFPFSMILKTIPTNPSPTKKIEIENSVDYGRYLTKIAGCESCHTPSVEGEKIEGMDFAGGFEFPVETGGVCRASNITPDVETGIGGWSKEQFIARFRYYQNNDSILVNQGEFNSEMPWKVYATMTEKDLGAIYDFLRTVKPVRNEVARFSMN